MFESIIAGYEQADEDIMSGMMSETAESKDEVRWTE